MKEDYLHQEVEETEHVEKEDVVKPKKAVAKKEVKKNAAELSKNTTRVDR